MNNIINRFKSNPSQSPDKQTTWHNLPGASPGIAIAEIAKNEDLVIVIVTANIEASINFENELKFFIDDPNLPILSLPDWETLPYDHFSPHQDIVSERIATLNQLPHLKKGILITSINTISHRLPPKSYLIKDTFNLKIKDQIKTHELAEQLQKQGYLRVNQVMEHGEFAIRGSIIDLFPTGSKYPFRLDLFDQEIESLRIFDPETQRSINKIEAVNLLPAKEFPITKNAVEIFKNKWKENFGVASIDSPLYQGVIRDQSPQGIEYYLPLFFNETNSFFDYLPQNSLLVTFDELHRRGEEFWQEVNNRYEERRYDLSFPILAPVKIFIPVNEIFSKFKNFPQINISKSFAENLNNHRCQDFFGENLPDLSIDHQLKNPLEALQNFLSTANQKILFCAQSKGRRESLVELLKTINIIPISYNSWSDFLNHDQKFGLVVGNLKKGFCFPKTGNQDGIILITETELFGETRIPQTRISKGKFQDPEFIIKNLTELKIGDPIVHLDYGVGRFKGLVSLSTQNQNTEFLAIEYAENTKLYVPVSSLDLVSRYTGQLSENAPLDQLGSQHWEKLKRKVSQKIYDVAAELLEIYAKRKSSPGFAFSFPKNEYQKFASLFPFEETIDQQKAIDAVISDMTSNLPMDRLICGDVGFGKTEVAMRASFIAAQNQKQVAILAPTTILVEQHFQNFKDRFSDWPINIEMISRFRSPKEQKIILEKIKNGQIDIIIGTHKLLQKDVKFKDLGLLVVDEEHRFGVKHKEKIKALRPNIDILSLTATPIPRTLNMSLIGIRDFSIIATAPSKRLAIKTFLKERNNQTIKEAITREIMRGGQVYFLHNNIATIGNLARNLETLIPSARISIAHGQMPERQLEKIMQDFYHLKNNILVCTTIIESGIDIPTANTIIIDSADHFGLAQLHQLRGRVGRSHHQAYAYLLINSLKLLSKDAILRLEAITQTEDLGAGFYLATHDLEIRGTGELLGEEQSGQIEGIGFNLYLEYLEKAIASLKAGKTLKLDEEYQKPTEIDLQIPCLIPDNYLDDVNLRLVLYKRIASTKNKEQLQKIQEEMIDRFGLFPLPIKNLFEIALLKIKFTQLGVKKIIGSNKNIILEFSQNNFIDPTQIINLIQQNPKLYKLRGSNKLEIILENQTIPKIELLKNFVQVLGK